MMKTVDRTPVSRVQLLDLDTVLTSPTKRNIKISSNQKFPSDFFQEIKDRNLIIQNRSKIVDEIFRSNSRNLPRTQQEVRNTMKKNNCMGNMNAINFNNGSQTLELRRRQMSTSTECRQGNGRMKQLNSNLCQEDLILSVLTTARTMKKMIRKHSIEFKRDQSEKKEEAAVELPPLKLRRGITATF